METGLRTKRGFFITLEGGEGSGKTTQVPVIADFFKERGYEVVCTREPGGTKLAEQIRSVLLTKDPDEELCDKSELLLMYAARAQLVATLIKPSLMQGKVVISDRFDLSTIAYQGAGRGLPLAEIAALRQVAIGDFAPDLTLLFDVPLKVGMARMLARGKADRIEQGGMEFFSRVQQGFLDYAVSHPEQVAIIDGSASIAEVSAQITATLQQRLAVL